MNTDKKNAPFLGFGGSRPTLQGEEKEHPPCPLQRGTGRSAVSDHLLVDRKISARTEPYQRQASRALAKSLSEFPFEEGDTGSGT